MIEKWLPVVGLEDKYSVSNKGRVRNDRKGNLLHGSLIRGYRQVSLWTDDGKIRVVKVHVLMLQSFVGPRPEGMWGLHWDDNGENNVLSNLRWGTPTDNMNDKVRNRRHGGAEKFKCTRGHNYDEKNTYKVPSTGKRHCRKCKLMEQRQRLQQTPKKIEC